MKRFRLFIAIATTALALTTITPITTYAAKAPKLSKKTVTLGDCDSYKLKLLYNKCYPAN